MSYKLEKPYTDVEYSEFIVAHQGLKLAESETAVYLLEPYEKLEGDTVIDNTEEYEREKVQKEKERISKLHLTKREVFLGLRKAKNVLPEQIRAQITDPDALIEFDYATEYYRGNPLIDMVGGALGITPTQLDRFFETNDYKELETKEGK